MSYHQTASTIAKSIDNSRTVAKSCANLAFLARHFVERGAASEKDPNVPCRVARTIADLGMVIGETSVLSMVEHWITPRDPVKFADVHAGSVHGVALELANRIHQAAADAIMLVHNEVTERRLEHSPTGVLKWENDGSFEEAWVRTRQFSPFIITYQTGLCDLLEAWHLETWNAVRISLSQQPSFDGQRLQAMIDCEHANAKRRLASWSVRSNRHASEYDVRHRAANAVEIGREPAVRMGTTWKEPVFVRGKKKHFRKLAQYKVIAALKEAGSGGLSKDDLEAIATDARKILNLLRKDADWASIIQMAEKKGNRYRLLD